DEFAETVVNAEGQRLTEALIQLLTNAVQHTADGVRISEGYRMHGARVWLWVSDSGSGVNADDASRIFDRFQRGQRSRSREGAGLGLGIVRSIAEAHGGTARVDTALVDTAEDQGATFVIDIPAVEEEHT